MGSLKNLSNVKINTHLIVSNSGLAEMFVYDELKKSCSATLDSIYTIDSKASFKEMLQYINMESLLSSRWLFVINYSKVKALCKEYKAIFNIDTSCYLVKVKNYKEFKEFKGLVGNCNDMYLSILRKDDIMYLLSGYNLSPKLLKFIIISYGREPEKVFSLKEKLELGFEVSTQKDIVNLVGISSGSINHFIFSLLKEKPAERGMNRVIKNRIQVANSLAKSYGLSTFKNFSLACAKDILDIKTLYLEGIIYDIIRDIPECYDEKKLSKYNKDLQKIIAIPYTRILNLYCLLKESGVWRSEDDMLGFIYKYYGGVE